MKTLRRKRRRRKNHKPLYSRIDYSKECDTDQIALEIS